MIYLVVGNKIERQTQIQNLCVSVPGNLHHLYDNDFTSASFQDRVPVDTGLFGAVEGYVIHDSIRGLDTNVIFNQYKKTDHIIIFSEDTVLKKIRTDAEKYAIAVIECGTEKKDPTPRFNIFSLADALGERNKKKLWLLFRESIMTASPEEIHGILFWQMKNISLVKTSSGNPGMNGFVFNKTKRFADNFSKKEILALNTQLIDMFHQRDIYSSLEIELEKMILSL